MFPMDLFEKNPDEIVVKGSLVIKPEDETGWDRLRKMFSVDQYGRPSKEVTTITQGTATATLFGGMIGAVLQSRTAFINFLDNNQATKFLNHYEAKRELVRIMYLAFGKGGFRWGWRIGLFSFSFISVTTIASVYYDKESLTDYILAGSVTGGIFKSNLGFKGMVAGSFAGGAIGTIGGAASLLVLKAGGMSMKELREFSQTMYIYRDEKIREATKKQISAEFTDFKDTSLRDEAFKNLDVDEK